MNRVNGAHSLWLGIACLFIGITGAQPAPGASFTGSFASDDQLFQTTWTTPTLTTLTAHTTSYATGGFVPVISLFNQGTGEYLAFDGADASCSEGRMEDARTGLCDDAYLSESVPAGSYRVVLSEFYNLPNGNYSDGFSEAGAGNFTAAACNASGPFWQVDVSPCVQRSGDYSLIITSAATVPEPAMTWPVALALIAVCYRRKGKGLWCKL